MFFTENTKKKLADEIAERLKGKANVKMENGAIVIDLNKEIMINRIFTYYCDCGCQVKFGIDDRLLDEKNWQPVPFMVNCPRCGNRKNSQSFLRHVFSTDLEFGPRPLGKNESYFKYDTSGNERACGIPIIKERVK